MLPHLKNDGGGTCGCPWGSQGSLPVWCDLGPWACWHSGCSLIASLSSRSCPRGESSQRGVAAGCWLISVKVFREVEQGNYRMHAGMLQCFRTQSPLKKTRHYAKTRAIIQEFVRAKLCLFLFSKHHSCCIAMYSLFCFGFKELVKPTPFQLVPNA